jgi:uncharacterized protein YcbK (DUF882 family)
MKIIKHKHCILFLLLPITFLLAWKTPQHMGDILYDTRHPNPPVKSKAEVDRILSGFKRIRSSQLPNSYLRNSGMGRSLGSLPEYFYVVEREDLHRRIVGRNRLRQVVCRDLRYRSSLFRKDGRLYVGIDPEILHKAVELQHSLRANGYDPDAIRITSGHRTPLHNRIVGGARASRHQRGDALDLQVGDVDRNGRTNRNDKQLVLDILERRVIGSRGGLGLYPGTQTVHMDLRGYRARWNSY